MLSLLHHELPASACLQAVQLREFNRRGDPEAVIRAFEGGAAVSSEETLGEYVKALVAVDRLDSSSLLQTLQVLLRSEVTCNGLFPSLHLAAELPEMQGSVALSGPTICTTTAVCHGVEHLGQQT